MTELINTQIHKIQHGNFTQGTIQRQKRDLQTPGPVSYTHLDVYKRQVNKVLFM